MSTPFFHLVAVVSVEPIHVLSPANTGASPSGGTPFPWMWVVGIVFAIAAIVALGVLTIGAITAYRRIRALHPEEQAFRSVCRTLRISSTTWPEIRALAKKIDAAPVALLVSRTAFDRAAGPRSSDLPASLVSLRTRLFGDDHAS